MVSPTKNTVIFDNKGNLVITRNDNDKFNPILRYQTVEMALTMLLKSGPINNFSTNAANNNAIKKILDKTHPKKFNDSDAKTLTELVYNLIKQITNDTTINKNQLDAYLNAFNKDLEDAREQAPTKDGSLIKLQDLKILHEAIKTKKIIGKNLTAEQLSELRSLQFGRKLEGEKTGTANRDTFTTVSANEIKVKISNSNNQLSIWYNSGKDHEIIEKKGSADQTKDTKPNLTGYTDISDFRNAAITTPPGTPNTGTPPTSTTSPAGSTSKTDKSKKENEKEEKEKIATTLKPLRESVVIADKAVDTAQEALNKHNDDNQGAPSMEDLEKNTPGIKTIDQNLLGLMSNQSETILSSNDHTSLKALSDAIDPNPLIDPNLNVQLRNLLEFKIDKELLTETQGDLKKGFQELAKLFGELNGVKQDEHTNRYNKLIEIRKALVKVKTDLVYSPNKDLINDYAEIQTNIDDVLAKIGEDRGNIRSSLDTATGFIKAAKFLAQNPNDQNAAASLATLQNSIDEFNSHPAVKSVADLGEIINKNDVLIDQSVRDIQTTLLNAANLSSLALTSIQIEKDRKELEKTLASAKTKAKKERTAFIAAGGTDLQNLEETNKEDEHIVAIAKTAKKAKQKPFERVDFDGAKMKDGSFIKEVKDDKGKVTGEINLGDKYGLDIRAATRQLLAKFPKANQEKFDAEIAKYFIAMLSNDPDRAKKLMDAEDAMFKIKGDSLDKKFGYQDYASLSIGGNYGLVSKVDDYVFGSIHGADDIKRIKEFYDYFSGTKSGALKYETELERKQQWTLAKSYIGTAGTTIIPIQKILSSGSGIEDYVKQMQEFLISKEVGKLPESMRVFTRQTGDKELDFFKIGAPAPAMNLMSLAEGVEIIDNKKFTVSDDLKKILMMVDGDKIKDIRIVVPKKADGSDGTSFTGKDLEEKQIMQYLRDNKLVMLEKVKSKDDEDKKGKELVVKTKKIAEFISKRINKVHEDYKATILGAKDGKEIDIAKVREQYRKLLDFNENAESNIFSKVTTHHRPISTGELTIVLHNFVENLKKFEAAAKAGTLPKNTLETYDQQVAAKKAKTEEKIANFKKRWSGEVRAIVAQRLPSVNRSLKARIPGYDSLAARTSNPGTGVDRFGIINRNPRTARARINTSSAFSTLEIRFS